MQSPADLSHKDAFTRDGGAGAARRRRRVHAVASDFLAYPLSSMYMQLPWSRSRRTMRSR
jgi:hypothetical protein